MGSRSGTQFAKLIVWALVGPFFLLSVVTNGLMPVQTPAGIAVVICSGEGPVELRVDPKTGKPVEDEPSDRRKVCDWASVGVNAQLPSITSIPQATTLTTEAAAPVFSTVLTAGLATGLPPSTGPPIVI